jgi:hypothetical protein
VPNNVEGCEEKKKSGSPSLLSVRDGNLRVGASFSNTNACVRRIPYNGRPAVQIMSCRPSVAERAFPPRRAPEVELLKQTDPNSPSRLHREGVNYEPSLRRCLRRSTQSGELHTD